MSILEHLLNEWYLDATTLLIVAVFFLLLGYRPPWFPKLSKTNSTTNSLLNYEKIPGPPSIPLVGTGWPQLLRWCGIRIGTTTSDKDDNDGGLGNLHLFYAALYKRYGPVVREEAFLNIPVVNVFERVDIEKVVRGAGKYPLRPPVDALATYRRTRPDRYATIGLINEQGEAWWHLRQAFCQVLTSPRTYVDFQCVSEAIADDWCDLLSRERDPITGRINCVDQLVNRLGIEISCAIVLGRRMGFLLQDGDTINTQRFADAVHNHFLATRDTYFGLPLWKYFSTPAYKRLVKSEEAIYELATELIKTADESTKDSPVFQSVLNADVDDRDKTAAIIDFIAAGIHTMKNTFLFMLHLIADHPDVQEQILTKNDTAYVKACLTESLRLYPTASPLGRITDEPLTLGGYKVPAGTVIVCHYGIACRDERNFPNANEFRPERWLEAGGGSGAAGAFVAIPFGVGRRICPGKRLVEQILPTLVEKMVQRFKWSVDEPLQLKFEFLLAPKGSMNLVLDERI